MREIRQKQMPLTPACHRDLEQARELAAIVKVLFGCQYRSLAFYLTDSTCLKAFYRIGIGQEYKKSTLQKNINALSAETWEKINRLILGYAENRGGAGDPH
ncbi:hypothetical protein SAMN02745216_03302 [Desulfatibacillum alkenivorans DSM 16219]|jgi:hypothetical protein|uniref:Uncharacterized protein n=1 Tax=Desulfatibacillum alkenivorans DSM 16219 TaxID=1121393 RepID=A0A1M6RN96_9BACT|nr:hypothetical protein SAMN02745216_03302 [Desulfatibacillum alkenivorans DSM 16219]